MRPARLSLLAVLLSLAACGGALSEGVSQFEKGRYPEAKQTFASLEDESHTWSDERRARYALYRGLTLGALGDTASAAVWLREAKAIEETHPGSLAWEDQKRLATALDTYDVR